MAKRVAKVVKMELPGGEAKPVKAAGIAKGSANAKTTKVGKVTKEQIKKIAEYKMPDLNANDIEAAIKIIEGSARNMGLDVVE